MKMHPVCWSLLLATLYVPSASAAEDVRVVSFNILSYNNPGSASFNALVRIVETLDADLLLIQEAANASGRAAFQAHFQDRYPFRALGLADGGGNRQQTFSRWPLLNPANLFTVGFSRPTLRVDVDTDPNNPGAELRIYNVHFKAGSSGNDADLRFAMANRIRDDIESLRLTSPDFRIIIGGDLNDEPGDPSVVRLHTPIFNMIFEDEQDPFTGSRATRPSSGRNLDHFIVSRTVDAKTETRAIYNTASFIGDPPGPAQIGDSGLASDHLALYLDFTLVDFIPGDTNVDGSVSVADINAFVLAITNQPAYRAAFPCADLNEVADINNDSMVSVGDITPFVELLTGG